MTGITGEQQLNPSGVMTNMLLIILILTTAQAAPSNEIPGIKSDLRFTNAISNLEIVYDGHFVQLNCFAENFKQVQWFKDDLPYPDWDYLSWLSGWVELRFHNQSLVIARTQKDVGGVYRCVASDGATTISKNITLRVVDAPYKGPALILQGNRCTDISAKLGDNVTFYCEVYVGSSNIAANAHWLFRNGDDDRMISTFVLPNTKSEIRFKDKTLMGSFLHINNVTEDLYGQYILSASMTLGEKTEAVLHLHQKREQNC